MNRDATVDFDFNDLGKPIAVEVDPVSKDGPVVP